MFGALGSHRSYTALQWQDQIPKTTYIFCFWDNYKTRRTAGRSRTCSSKPPPRHPSGSFTEVAENTEARLPRGVGGAGDIGVQLGGELIVHHRGTETRSPGGRFLLVLLRVSVSELLHRVAQ